MSETEREKSEKESQYKCTYNALNIAIRVSFFHMRYTHCMCQLTPGLHFLRRPGPGGHNIMTGENERGREREREGERERERERERE